MRRARVVLAFMLVPVVLLANPQTASATLGPWSQVSVTVPLPVIGEGYGGNGTCAFNVQHADTSVNVGSGGYCIGLPDVTPGSTQPLEAGSTIGIIASGQFRSGGECSGDTTVTLGPHDKNGTIRVAGSIPSTTLNLSGTALGEDCDIARICISVGNGGSPACQNVALPSPDPVEPPAGSCIYGTPSVGAPVVKRISTGTTAAHYKLEFPITFAAEQPPGIRWTAQPYYETTQWYVATTGAKTMLDRFVGETTMLGGQEIVKNKDLAAPVVGDFGRAGFQFSAPLGPTVSPDGGSWNTLVGSSADNFSQKYARPSSAGSGYNIPPGASNYYGGWTDPAVCRFWIGPKVIDIAGYDNDEPSSQIGVPVTPPPVEPVIEEPPPIEPPEGFDWLQAIWAVLKSILSALGGLAQAIVDGIASALSALADAILDGLEELFVPDRSLASRMDELDGLLDDRFPFNVAASLGSMGIGAGGAPPAGAGVPVAADGGGCPSWEVIVQTPGGGETYDAVCDSSFTSAIRGARPFILAGLLTAAFWPLVRGLFFASVPVIKPVPTNNS
jgi:hypothetical protein